MTTLSLCAIVRNEAELLPRMLRSVSPFVDEIVVVDTGSTDGTQDVARSLGARVIAEPFDDDFSAPRNVSLAAAKGDWILVLDADEWLEDGAGAAIRAAIDTRRACGFYLRFENHLGGGRVHRCGLMRLFRRDDAIRFEYCIHEQVIPSLLAYARRRGLELAPLDSAVVHHDGYLKGRVVDRQKDERNARLFARQVERHPDHAYSWYKFGDFLRRFEDRRAEAIAALERARALIDVMPAEAARELSFCAEVHALLALERDKCGDAPDALRIAENGLRYGETPNLLYVLGHLHAKAERHVDALRCYARLRLSDRRLHAIPPEPGITGASAFHGMGRALANLGRRRAAARCLDESVKLDPRRADNRLLRARIRVEAGDVPGAAEDYAAAVECEPAAPGPRLRLGALLLRCGEFEGARRHFETALTNGAEPKLVAPKLGQAQLALGRFEDSLDSFASVPADRDSKVGLRILTILAEGGDPREGEWLRAPQARSWLPIVAAATARVAGPGEEKT